MINLAEHIPADFSDNSRVWIYQANRMLHLSEVFEVETMISEFIPNWHSHGAPVKGFANLFFGRFLVIFADESKVKVGGCSTDSSVHLVKAIEEKFDVDFFNRQLVAFLINDKVEQIPLNQVAYALNNGIISQSTLFFDNTVLTKEQLINRWITPVSESWLGKRYPILN